VRRSGIGAGVFEADTLGLAFQILFAGLAPTGEFQGHQRDPVLPQECIYYVKL